MFRKKAITAVVCLALAAGAAGCSKDSDETTAAAEDTQAEVTETTEATDSPETETESEATGSPETETESEATGTVTETEAEPAETTEPFILGDDGFLPEYDTFELSSEDLNDGVWADIISNTDAGEDVSPQLSWEPVDGADHYVIYMIDTSASYWGHWKSDMVTGTDLERGWAANLEYVGPYPPSGSTHTYDIYVVALKAPVERLMGVVNNQNPNFADFIRGLDTDADGNTGNIISYGYLSGEFTSPEA